MASECVEAVFPEPAVLREPIQCVPHRFEGKLAMMHAPFFVATDEPGAFEYAQVFGDRGVYLFFGRLSS